MNAVTAAYTMMVYTVRGRRGLNDDFLLNIGHVTELLVTELGV